MPWNNISQERLIVPTWQILSENKQRLCDLGIIVLNSSHKMFLYFGGLIQETRNSSALAMELSLSCATPSILRMREKSTHLTASSLCVFQIVWCQVGWMETGLVNGFLWDASAASAIETTPVEGILIILKLDDAIWQHETWSILIQAKDCR